MTDSVVTRVLVIDPSFLFYQGVFQALAGTEFQIVAWVQEQKTALTECRENTIDLALVGHSFSPHDGLALCRALRAQSEQIKIILISEHADSALFQQDARYAGADACAPSSIGHANFLAACRAAAHGARERETASANPEPPRLTPRELEILQLVAQGQNDKEIAKALHSSVNTVRNHMQNILRKLEVNDRATAVWRARHRNLI